jgi:hypothetical protein
MQTARTMRSILLSGTLACVACAPAQVTVTAAPAGCAALLPEAWRQPVEAPDFEGGNVVGDWIAYADAVTGRLDIANDRTISAISIVERCETRDREAIRRATRRRFLGVF